MADGDEVFSLVAPVWVNGVERIVSAKALASADVSGAGGGVDTTGGTLGWATNYPVVCHSFVPSLDAGIS